MYRDEEKKLENLFRTDEGLYQKMSRARSQGSSYAEQIHPGARVVRF